MVADPNIQYTNILTPIYFYNAKDDYACIAVKFFKEKVAPLLKEYGVII